MQVAIPIPHHGDQKKPSAETSGGTSYSPRISMKEFQKKQAIRNPGKNAGR